MACAKLHPHLVLNILSVCLRPAQGRSHVSNETHILEFGGYRCICCTSDELQRPEQQQMKARVMCGDFQVYVRLSRRSLAVMMVNGKWTCS